MFFTQKYSSPKNILHPKIFFIKNIFYKKYSPHKNILGFRKAECGFLPYSINSMTA